MSTVAADTASDDQVGHAMEQVQHVAANFEQLNSCTANPGDAYAGTNYRMQTAAGIPTLSSTLTPYGVEKVTCLGS
jgi:hypothetical protein